MGAEWDEHLGDWRFAAAPEYVPQMRHRVGRIIEGLGVDEGAVALAVTEAVANAVRHAYPAGGGEVRVMVCADDDGVVISVIDKGVGVRGFTASRGPGAGLGLGLIRALADRVRIEPGSGGTLVEMVFERSGRGPSRRPPKRSAD
jgi:anti-sigma regulatory factor (Ser/Thr protein kinase)